MSTEKPETASEKSARIAREQAAQAIIDLNIRLENLKVKKDTQ